MNEALFDQSERTLETIRRRQETAWQNPRWLPFDLVRGLCDLVVSEQGIADAEARLSRFAPFLRRAFPETRPENGLIESPLVEIEAMRQALEQAGLPADCISLVQDTSHDTANELMHLDGYVDVLIPRGGAGLIRAVAKEASVPVIRAGEGVCHIYIDDEADLDMGASILFNAKCSRPSVCNAVECVLVHRDVAADFWKKALPLLDEKGVELRADPEALEILGTRAVPAEDSDWDAEYDDYILAVKTAGGMDEAIDFINAHGTQHSEAIITKNYFKAQRFLDAVDAAAVYVNASTRFTDGGEFGLGAEIGISTQKMHARGPMGLEELTSCKYVVYGEGQVR